MMRRVAIAVGALLLLLVGGVAVFLATLDVERFRPRIQAAAQGATGRAVEFGPMRLSLGLSPAITVRDLRLANLPGGTRPHMLTVGEAELKVALLPLLSGNVSVRRLVLNSPSILLETVNGEPNWRLAPATPPGPAAPGPVAAPARRPTTLDIGEVQVRDATLEFPGGPPGGVTLATLDASGRGNLSLRGALRWADTALTFDAEGGPLARLLGAPGPAWPLRLRVEAAGARVQLQGEVREPRGLLDYRMEVTAEAPTLVGVQALLGRPLPPLTGLSLRGRLTGSGFGLPVPEAMTLAMGATTLAPGLELARLEISMQAAAEPARISAQGTRAGQPFTLAGTIGPLGPAVAGGALALDLTGEHAGHSIGARGTVTRPMAGVGIELAVTATSPVFGQARGQVKERGAFFAEGAELAEMVLEGPIVAGGGTLTVSAAPLPRVAGRLALSRLDVDAARLALAPSPAPAAAAPGPAAPPARTDRRLIPDMPLDLRPLSQAAADVTFAVETLRWNGSDYRAVEGRLILADARARLDPLALTLPAGRVTLRLAADGSGPVPQMQVSARGDALELGALGAPLSGRGELDLDLRGQGADLRAWAASAIGHVGVAVTEGRVASSVVRGALPAQAQGLASEIGLACLAARFDLVAGIGQARTLFVDSSLGRATGQGQVSLRDETLALRLNTDLRLPVPGTPGLRVRAPLPVSGTFAAPRFDGSAMAGGALSGQAERLIPGLGQALGSGTPATMSDCGTALGLARGGRPGPVPASQAPIAPVETPAAPAPRPQVQDLLRGFLGR